MKLPEDRKGKAKLGALIGAGIGAYLLYRNFFPEFDLQQILDDVSTTLGAWTYVLVSVFAFLETGAFVGLIAPGETMVVLAGAVAGQGETSVLLTIALVWFGAFLGDTASFFLGVKLGRGFVIEHGPRFRITPERFAQVESYFERHGGKTILIGRFIGVVRALAPFVAGSSGMRYGAMAPFSILGTGLWATFFTLLGFFAAQNLDAVVNASEKGFFFFGVAVAIGVGIYLAVRFLRDPANRRRAVERMESSRLLRPVVALGRRLRPQARFLWNRLTPGDLGLELTAPAAALAVASFIFVAYALIVGDDPGPTPGDTTAADLAESLRAGWLTTIEKGVTELGSGLVVSLVGIGAGIVLAVKRRYEELGVLVFALVLMAIAIPELKDAIDRPRPGSGLIDVASQSYPSAHAAYSVLYTWIALIVAIRLRPTWGGATALLVGGILLTAAIGLSRVYLGAHYLSDVSGGWAFGVCAFTIGTVIAVVVSHFRQNPDSGA